MPLVMEPSWVGRRISIRRVLEHRPDCSPLLGDVVGDLVGLDAQTAVVDTRSGLVEIPVPTVAIARLVPASTAAELALEAVAAQGLRPAEVRELSGWRLRADEGFTRRANSVLPLRQIGLPLDDALGEAREWYRERGLPLRLHLPVEARRLLDAALGERGWEPEVETHVMTARLDAVSAGEPTSDGLPVELLDRPDDAWLSLYRAGAGATIGVAATSLLTRHDQVVFASIRVSGQTVAVGRGVVDDGWLGVMGIEVDAGHRRQGFAQLVMAELWRWGSALGAARGYLQVTVDNAPAVALYDKLGYWVHHDYRYRLDPEAGVGVAVTTEIVPASAPPSITPYDTY